MLDSQVPRSRLLIPPSILPGIPDARDGWLNAGCIENEYLGHPPDRSANDLCAVNPQQTRPAEHVPGQSWDLWSNLIEPPARLPLQPPRGVALGSCQPSESSTHFGGLPQPFDPVAAQMQRRAVDASGQVHDSGRGKGGDIGGSPRAVQTASASPSRSILRRPAYPAYHETTVQGDSRGRGSKDFEWRSALVDDVADLQLNDRFDLLSALPADLAMDVNGGSNEQAPVLSIPTALFQGAGSSTMWRPLPAQVGAACTRPQLDPLFHKCLHFGMLMMQAAAPNESFYSMPLQFGSVTAPYGQPDRW